MISLRLISALVLVYCSIATTSGASLEENELWFLEEIKELVEAVTQHDQDNTEIQDAKTVPENCTVCAASKDRSITTLLRKLKKVRTTIEAVKEHLTEIQVEINVELTTVGNRSNPASSCQQIFLTRANPLSGFYWIRPNNDSTEPVKVYCDMGRVCGREEGGWMRLTSINMTRKDSSCPSGLREEKHGKFRVCAKDTKSECSSTVFATHGIGYSRVCGKAIGYQVGSPDAFTPGIDIGINATANDIYIDGVSLTYGMPRSHIWSFAAALTEGEGYGRSLCPCNESFRFSLPSFIKNDFFCESGNKGERDDNTKFFGGDRLWDGETCGENVACCKSDNPPWFTKTLSPSTCSDIEMRICTDQETISDENVLLEQLELYLQ